jgi:hypothetical protein
VLDSSNQLQEEDETFNSQKYFRDLCFDHNIEVSHMARIQFPKGWSKLLLEFVTRVKNYGITITEVSDFYSVLDIQFEVVRTTKETQVWRAINYVRQMSVLTCGSCTNSKSVRKGFTPINVLCEKCINDAHLINKTGTWLDKY